MLTTSSTTEETFLNKKRANSKEKEKSAKIDDETKNLKEITEILVSYLRHKKHCTVLEFTKYAYGLSEKKKGKEHIKNIKTYEKEMILDVIKVLVHCGTIEFSEKNYSLYINEKVKTLVDKIDTKNNNYSKTPETSKSPKKTPQIQPIKILHKSLIKLLKLYTELNFNKKYSSLNSDDSSRFSSHEKITFPFVIINSDVDNITIKSVNENKRLIFLSENKMNFIKPKDIVFNIGIKDLYWKMKENEKKNEKQENIGENSNNNITNILPPSSNAETENEELLHFLLSFPFIKSFLSEEHSKFPSQKTVPETQSKKQISDSPQISRSESPCQCFLASNSESPIFSGELRGQDELNSFCLSPEKKKKKMNANFEESFGEENVFSI